jgi:hypothetical protein
MIAASEKSKLQYNQTMHRFALALLIVSLICACGNTQKTKSDTVAKTQKPSARKTTSPPKREYVGDNIAPIEIRALRAAKQLQKDIAKKQEAEKEILKQRD